MSLPAFSIVVADDFGWTPEITRAISLAFERGLVTHASAMTTMPDFDAAVAAAERLGVVDRIGVHIVLTEGLPLTDAMRRSRRFCGSDGSFRPRRRTFVLTRDERDVVAQELRAQIGRARAAGLAVTHVDSHHHAHNEPAILRIVVALAGELGVDRVRLAPNAQPRTPVHRVYKATLNRVISRAGLAGTRYVASVTDVSFLAQPRHGEVELVVHPLLGHDGGLIDRYGGQAPLEAVVAAGPAAPSRPRLGGAAAL